MTKILYQNLGSEKKILLMHLSNKINAFIVLTLKLKRRILFHLLVGKGNKKIRTENHQGLRMIGRYPIIMGGGIRKTTLPPLKSLKNGLKNDFVLNSIFLSFLFSISENDTVRNRVSVGR